MKNHIKGERGSVLVVVALAMMVFLLFSAFTIDIGRTVFAKQSLQNAVDASALAAAKELINVNDSYKKTKATTQAELYMDNNGHAGKLVGDPVFTNSDKKVTLYAEEYMEYTIFKLFKDGTTVKVSAAAQIQNPFDAYPYALFSGNKTEFVLGSNNSVTGAIHSNGEIIGNQNNTLNGNVTCVGNIDKRINISAPFSIATKAAIIGMPEFEKIYSDKLENPISLPTGYYDSKKNAYVMSGDDLNTLLAQYPILYLDKDIIVNGSGVNATGSIVTTGKITFNGGNVKIDGSSLVVCSLYTSKNKNDQAIEFNGGGETLYGTLFAPNGIIEFNGKTDQIVGRVIADTIKGNGGLNVIYDPNSDGGLPADWIRLVD